jgi:hypothetical protein
VGWWSTDALADEYKLTDGTTIWGTVSDANESGVVFRLDSGGFSDRISWGKFSDPTLEILASDPKMREFAEPFIPVPPEARPKPKPVVVREDYPKVELPAGRTTIFSSLTTPIGLAILGLLYVANLLAGYEVALYRNRPVSVVCGLSAVLPLVGPLAFLASPSLEAPPSEFEEEAELEEAEAGPAVPEPGSPGGATSRKVGAPPRSSSLRMAASTKGSKGPAEKKVYNRSEHTFNRRFIETQFSGFFRVVPTDAEKDMVLVIKTPKQEYVARRISRISATEMYVQLLQAGSKEVRVVLGEIAQIIVRHKDDKS